MADINAKGKCITCQFFIEQFNLGECHRNPITINKSRNDWCGEYQADMPVIPSFTPDTPNPIQNLVEAVTADPLPPLKNKPGRPKKDQK
jgi:hypothetical protein